MHPPTARVAFLLVFVVHALVACGGKGAAPPPESATAPAAPPAAGTSAPVSAVRTRVDPNADLIVYLDGAGFRTSPFFRALERALAMLPGAGAERAKIAEQCGFDPIQAIAAVAVSATGAGTSLKEDSVIVAAEFTQPSERVLSCIARLSPKASATEIEGRKALTSPDGIVIVGDGNLLLAGPRTRVVSALEQAPLPPSVLDSGTYLHIRTNALKAFALNQLTFSMGRGPAGTRLRIMDEAGSVEAAKRTETRFREFRELAKQRLSQSLESPDAQRYLAELLDAMVIQTNGTAVSATVDLPSAQAEDAFTGMISALAIYGVRRYIGQAKMAEARSNVAVIAKNLGAYVASKAAKRFPKTAPRTPATIPAGTKVKPDAKTWSHASWKAIGFQLEEPHYYSYEYETSRDGKHVTVRAHGDLDGDGVTSRFELTLEITGAGEAVLGPELVEVEPME